MMPPDGCSWKVQGNSRTDEHFPGNIREFPILPCYKDWNDALLGKTNPEYLKETEGLVNPIEVRHSGQDEEERQSSYHR